MPEYLSPGVYVEEVNKGSMPIAPVGTAMAAFVGITETMPSDEPPGPSLVTNWSQFQEKFGGYAKGSYLAHSVYGYFNNGGSRCYIVSIGTPSRNGALAAPAPPVAEPLSLPNRTSSARGTLRLTPKIPADQARDLTVEVGDATPPENPEASEVPHNEQFMLTVKSSRHPDEVFDRLNLRPDSPQYVETVLAQSTLLQVEDLRLTTGPVTQRLPRTGEYHFTITVAGPLAQTTPQTLAAKPEDFVGDVTERTGIGGLELPEDVTILCVPDLMAAYQQGSVTLEQVQSVQQAMIDHCQNMKDRVAILDAPPDMKPQRVRDWRVSEANYDSSYASLYYPWIKVFDPSSGENILVPPCGHMAGIWARNDNTRGVHKAPANEVIAGAVDVEYRMTKGEQDVLNPRGINCIRAFPGRGIRVWGARTLSSEASWTYLNVRRLFNMIEKSIYNGTQWVVFEPNDFALWQRIIRNVSSFLDTQWMAGALFGATPAQAYYVKCDEETNPQAIRDLGMVITEMGICPVKPAEFVIFRITQWSPNT